MADRALVDELKEILVDTRRTRRDYRAAPTNLDAVAALAYVTRRLELLIEAVKEGRVDA